MIQTASSSVCRVKWHLW